VISWHFDPGSGTTFLLTLQTAGKDLTKKLTIIFIFRVKHLGANA